MQVDSPLALYTLVLGWKVYNELWETLSRVGIVFVPFFGVFARAFLFDREDGHAMEDAPRQALVRVEAKVLLMLLAIVFCGVPAPNLVLTSGTVSYAPTSSGPLPPANPAATYGASGFGAHIDGRIPVPVWWFVTIAISEGLNRATLDALPTLAGLHEIEQAARLTAVQDPTVRTEVSQFFTDCYVPARSLFMRDMPAGVSPDDVNWVGAAYLLDTYYGQLRARALIPGFPYDPARDTEFVDPPPSGWGRPTCDDWWLGLSAVGDGLRAKLVAEVNNSGVGLTSMIVDVLPSGLTPEVIEDRAVEAMLSRDPPSLIDTSLYDQRGTQLGFVGDQARNAFITVGLTTSQFFMSLAADMTVLGLPVMQSLILMFIFALLPFGIVFSSYNWQFMITAAVSIFSIYFWIPIWHLVEWTREQLIVALYQGQSTPDQMLDALLFLTNVSISDATKGLVIDLACTTMYFVGPGIFTWLLTMAGSKAGGLISGALYEGVKNSLPTEAAKGSANVAQSAASRFTRR